MAGGFVLLGYGKKKKITGNEGFHISSVRYVLSTNSRLLDLKKVFEWEDDVFCVRRHG